MSLIVQPAPKPPLSPLRASPSMSFPSFPSSSSRPTNARQPPLRPSRYVAEVSPAHLRGQLGSLFNLGISCGVLLVDFLNACGLDWRVLAWLTGALVPFIGLLAMMRFPESPVFLAAAAAGAVDEQAKCAVYKVSRDVGVNTWVQTAKHEIEQWATCSVRDLFRKTVLCVSDPSSQFLTHT